MTNDLRVAAGNVFGASTPASALYKRYGDLYATGTRDYPEAARETWYTPDHLLTDISVDSNDKRQADTELVWEGIGTGWFYSVAGGGVGVRPYSVFGQKLGADDLDESYIKQHRTSVLVDNTYVGNPVGTLMRGDYAVSTLFNGDFDSTAQTGFFDTLTAIPGWTGLNQNQLKTWSAVGAANDLAAGYPNSYALELFSGQSITHNAFVVPDWGALRFDLFTEEIASTTTGTLRVFLDALDGSTATEIDYVDLQRAVGTETSYEADTHRIGYGETGFETFTVDIPDAWRGKVGTLRFELNDSTQPIYLDNVFFKSESLLLGNPGDARFSNQQFSQNPNNKNLLIEKSQYTLSYNGQSNIANWSAWKVNSTWRQDQGGFTERNFENDVTLPPGFYRAVNADLSQANSTIKVDGVSTYYNRGHLSPLADRNRNAKDGTAVNLMSNIVPQEIKSNGGTWAEFEAETRRLYGLGKEVYVFSGTY